MAPRTGRTTNRRSRCRRLHPTLRHPRRSLFRIWLGAFAQELYEDRPLALPVIEIDKQQLLPCSQS